MSDAKRLSFSTGALPGGYEILFTARRATGLGPLVASRARFIGLNRVKITRSAQIPLHQHTVHELVMVESGPYRCRINGTPLTVASGGVLVVTPGDGHEVELHRGQRHSVLHFALAGSRGSTGLFHDDSPPEAHVVSGGSPELGRAIRRLLEEVASPDAYTTALQDLLMEEIYWRLLRVVPAQARVPGLGGLEEDEDFRARLATLFEASLAGTLPVTTMAKELGMSRRNLTDKCRRVFGQGPAHAFMDLKLQRAALRLAETTASVKHVSYELGFRNPYHFSRAFRARFGLAPSGFRAAGTPRRSA